MNISMLIEYTAFTGKDAESVPADNLNQITITNTTQCTEIQPGGNCIVSFTTPPLSYGNSGNSVVNLTYQMGGETKSTNQIVNYSYVDASKLDGINFTNNLLVSQDHGATAYVVGYLYAGSKSSLYKDVTLDIKTPGLLTVNNGFINHQEMAANQVIPVEFAVNMEQSNAGHIEAVPTWSSTSGRLSGGPLSAGIVPSQNYVNLLFGNASIITLPQSSAMTINVVNNGNADSTQPITATVSGSGSSQVQVTNNCSGQVVQAYGATSCNFQVNITGSTPGTANIQFSYGGSVVSTQNIYWTNNLPYPLIGASPNPGSVSINQSSTSGIVTFTISNVGNAPLSNVTYTANNSNQSAAAWTESVNSCTTTLPAQSSCTITGTLASSSQAGSGMVYYAISGTYNSQTYNTSSLPLNFAVSGDPSIMISSLAPYSTGYYLQTGLLANGVMTESAVYTLTNQGGAVANISSISLINTSSTVLKPTIASGSTCGATLAVGASCSVTVAYGPTLSSTTESGTTALQVAYNGGTPFISTTTVANIQYSVTGNNSYVIESTTVTNLPGSGTSGSPYASQASLNSQIIMTYTNPNNSSTLNSFNANVNGLPYGLTVDPSSTCATGSNTQTLAIGQSCTVILDVNNSLLQSSPAGDAVILDFTIPSVSWNTAVGGYNQSFSQIYLNYLQPSVVFNLSANNSAFNSTILTMFAANATRANALNITVGSVSSTLGSNPQNNSSNCTIAGGGSVSCNLYSTNTGSVTYIMPQYIIQSQNFSFPLQYSVNSGSYASLNPSMTWVNYTSQQPAVTISTVVGTSTSPSIQLKFNKPVFNVNSNTVQLRVGSASGAIVPLTNIASSNDHAQFVFSSASPLAANTTYFVVINSGIIDGANDPLAAVTPVSFTTTSGATNYPNVQMNSPLNNASNVSTSATVQLSFSEPVTGLITSSSAYAGSVTVRANNATTGTLVPVTTISSSDNMNYNLQFGSLLLPGITYYVTLSNGIINANGTALGAGNVFSFNTSNYQSPTASLLSPVNNSVGNSLYPSIALTFSESVLNVNTSNVQLMQYGVSPVALPINIYSSGSNSYNIVAGSALLPNQTYEVTVSNAITSSATGATSKPYVFFFQTGASALPTVQMTSPLPNSSDVPLNPVLALRFSESVQNVSTSTVKICTTPSCTTTVAVNTPTSAGNNVYTVSPTSNLTQYVPYYIVVSGVTDMSGNNLVPYVASFIPGDYTAPQVATVSINNGVAYSGLYPAGTESIAITFTEPVLNVSTSTVTMATGGSNVPLTLVGQSGNTYTFVPNSTLSFETTYTISLSNAITDTSINVNPLGGTTSYTFSTRRAYVLLSSDNGWVTNGQIGVGGLAGANAFCNSYGTMNTSVNSNPKFAGRTWMAIIVSGNGSQSATRGTGTAYYNANDQQIISAALNIQNLNTNTNMTYIQGSLTNPISVAGSNVNVWTGTNLSGNSTCNNWTNGSSGSAYVGSSLVTGNGWANSGSGASNCNAFNGLYCAAQN